MRKIVINGKTYKEPTSIADITIKQMVRILNSGKEVKNIEINEAADLINVFVAHCQLIADCSTIPISVLTSMPDAIGEDLKLKGVLKQVSDHFVKLFQDIAYKPNKELIKHFDFGKPKGLFKKPKRYYLFEFGNSSVEQQLWFQSEWKFFFNEALEAVEQMDYTALPKLIACIAFPKDEIKMAFNRPDALKEDIANDLGNKLAERAIEFENLPLSIAYRCIDYFFFNSPKFQKVIRMYFPEGRASRQKQKGYTESTTLLSRA